MAKRRRVIRRLTKRFQKMEDRQRREMLRWKHDVIHSVNLLLREYSPPDEDPADWQPDGGRKVG